jgi:hypothetical protein
MQISPKQCRRVADWNRNSRSDVMQNWQYNTEILYQHFLKESFTYTTTITLLLAHKKSEQEFSFFIKYKILCQNIKSVLFTYVYLIT